MRARSAQSNLLCAAVARPIIIGDKTREILSTQMLCNLYSWDLADRHLVY